MPMLLRTPLTNMPTFGYHPYHMVDLVSILVRTPLHEVPVTSGKLRCVAIQRYNRCNQPYPRPSRVGGSGTSCRERFGGGF